MFNSTRKLKKERINHQDEWSTFCLWGEAGGSDHHHRSLEGEFAVLPVQPVHSFPADHIAQVLAIEVGPATLLIPPGAYFFLSTVITTLLIIAPVFCNEEHSVQIT